MDTSIFDLTGRKAIVTGAGKGIGKAIALGLAKAGADVAICDIALPDAEVTAEQIRELGRRSVPIKADVRIKGDVENLFRRTLEELDDVDILVNNAGGSFAADFMDISERGWDAVVNENLKTVFLCCQEAGKIMIKNKKGNIINISSMAGITGHLTSQPYGAAKAGVINFTKTLSTLWAQYNIRVNAIAPGWTDTEGGKSQMEKIPGQKEARIRKIPMGRYGKPEEIAAGVIYLASDAASYVTGITLEIAGGLPDVCLF